MRSGIDVDPPDTGKKETTRWHYEHDWQDDDSDHQGEKQYVY